MNEIIVTGTGRCGTGFVARLLTSAGRPCTHEGVFGLGGWDVARERLLQRKANPHWEFHAESSWMATPFLDKPEMEGVTVVQLVRHPKDVMDSFIRMMAYGDMNNRPYFRWMAERFPTIDALNRPQDKAAYWYVKLNQLCERRADVFHRIEDDPRELLDKLGIDWQGRELFNDTTYNARTGHGPSDVQLDDIQEPFLRMALTEMADRYGYSWVDYRPRSVMAKWFGGREIEVSLPSAMLGGAWQLRDEENNALCYDAPLVRFFYEKAKRYDRPVVVDVGASSGNFALLPKLHSGMTVHAFEPNPAQFNALAANVTLNGLEDQVTLYDCALSDSEGEGELCVPIPAVHAAVACLGSGAPRPRGFEWHKIPVKIKTLDSFNLAPDLLKIDVEGAELLVLEGARQTIARHRPGILLEYTSLNTRQFGYEREELLTWLAYFGYTMKTVGLEDLWAEP